jgi:hypothetical protein
MLELILSLPANVHLSERKVLFTQQQAEITSSKRFTLLSQTHQKIKAAFTMLPQSEGLAKVCAVQYKLARSAV